MVQRGEDTVLQNRIDEGNDDPANFRNIMTLQNVQLSSITRDNFVGGVDPNGSRQALDLVGTAGDDILTGSWLDDRLAGGAGDDILTGGVGDDLLFGGTGLDTARYSSLREEYSVSGTAAMGKWVVADARGGPDDGTDQLDSIERLVFANGALALDLDGIAAQAYRLYRAAFARAPEEEGLGFWIAMLDRGITLHTAAGAFASTPELRDLYGAAPSTAGIVTRLYHNVLGREPEQGGFEFWIGVLDSQRADLATVLAAFSDSAENVEAVAPLIGQGIAYQPWGG